MVIYVFLWFYSILHLVFVRLESRLIIDGNFCSFSFWTVIGLYFSSSFVTVTSLIFFENFFVETFFFFVETFLCSTFIKNGNSIAEIPRRIFYKSQKWKKAVLFLSDD